MRSDDLRRDPQRGGLSPRGGEIGALATIPSPQGLSLAQDWESVRAELVRLAIRCSREGKPDAAMAVSSLREMMPPAREVLR